MTRRRRTYAFIQYDEHHMTEFVCVDCMKDEDSKEVRIQDKGAVICDRCGKVCE